MRHLICVCTILLLSFTNSFAQTNSVEIFNNTPCDIYVTVDELNVSPGCGFLANIVTSKVISSGNSLIYSGYIEFSIDVFIPGAGFTPTVYIDAGCGPQSGNTGLTDVCYTSCTGCPPLWTIGANVVSGGGSPNWIVNVQ